MYHSYGPDHGGPNHNTPRKQQVDPHHPEGQPDNDGHETWKKFQSFFRRVC